MMATRRLEVEIVGDTSSLERALGRTQHRSNSLASTLGKAGLAGAAIGLGVAVKAGFSEFVEAQKVAAQTSAVIRSTGGAANVTAGQVDKLAGSLMRKSGVDDEQIASGENMLLTFTRIRNEVGAGNDIFNQATEATLNLSVAMGKDMQSSAILVGKALNDPIKGMTALSRAGIQFTEEQKETIKTLVASGDQMGAQKIILKELETQFGGSAEAAGNTFGGQVNIAKESLLNLAGEGVATASPALASFATAINDDVIPVIRRFYNWFNDNVVPVLKELARVAKETWEGIKKVLQEHEPEIKRILGAVESAARAIGTVLLWVIQEVWIPIVGPVFTTGIPLALGFTLDALNAIVLAGEGVKTGFVWLRDHGKAAVTAFTDAVDGPLDTMADVFGKIAVSLGKVVDAIEWLIKNIGRIPKPPGFLTGLIGGDETGRKIGIGDIPGNVTAGLAGISSIGAQHGLIVTSAFRPGDPGDHGRGKALDISNTFRGDRDGTPQMDAAFLALAAVAGAIGIKDLLYEPGLWKYGFNIDNGRRAAFTVAGHGDHIHASVFDRGGWLPPFSKTLAINNTPLWEPVGPPGAGGATHVTVHVHGSVQTEEDLVSAVKTGLNRIGYRNDGTILA